MDMFDFLSSSDPPYQLLAVTEVDGARFGLATELAGERLSASPPTLPIRDSPSKSLLPARRRRPSALLVKAPLRALRNSRLWTTGFFRSAGNALSGVFR